MRAIYRTYEDTEIVMLATNVECPYCYHEWQEEDKDECGETYILKCPACGKKFKMYFDAN